MMAIQIDKASGPMVCRYKTHPRHRMVKENLKDQDIAIVHTTTYLYHKRIGKSTEVRKTLGLQIL